MRMLYWLQLHIKYILINLSANEFYMSTIVFTFFPVVFGDGLGEIIGCIWGKQKMKVWGIGEINKKSWLGTIFVFLGTFGSITLYVFYGKLALHYFLLAFLISIVSSILELISPRSMDNIIMPSANILIFQAWIVLFT